MARFRRTQSKKPKVVIFGFNGITEESYQSILNEIRGPDNENTLHEMPKYGRVEEDDYLNLYALLAGGNQNRADLRSSYIFQHFKNQGYATAFAEDLSFIRKYPFEFEELSADFYLRPLLNTIAGSVHLDSQTSNLKSANYVYDYGEQFLKRYLKSSQPIFGLFWSTNSEKENTKHPFVEYLKRFKKFGLLEETIVIFISDHLCKSSLSIWLPNKFREEHPSIVTNLDKNTNQLTSPYDLYLTLQDITELENKNHTKLLECPNCQSLFEELPINRRCQDAGRSKVNCDCDSSTKPSLNETLNSELGTLVIKHINMHLQSTQLLEHCEEFTLQKVESVNQITTEVIPKYRVQVMAQPKSVIFFASVIYNPANQKIEKASVRTFRRFYRDKNESDCQTEKKFRKICLCKTKKQSVKPDENNDLKEIMEKLIKKVEDLEKNCMLQTQSIKKDIIKLKDMMAKSTENKVERTLSKTETKENPESSESHSNTELSMHF
ncbi:uncharacterized protein LOC108098754 [Drosophila ficusphila]|uniref:uncharacterized protein LOC108098754 n=1 Tax=Drosophila ficusphila TaxID=30025 RepID=UPI001C8A27A7|nr:uncharacterized protein LOC108098754 [Drosophila ficusphila]